MRRLFLALALLSGLVGGGRQAGAQVADPAQRPRYSPNCGAPADHDQADLCVQLRMADAVREQLWWTAAQTYTAWGGSLLILFTLFYTARAARAATSQATIARQAMIADQRAWIKVEVIMVEGVTYYPTGQVFGAAAKITNIGKTLAFGVHTKMDMVAGIEEIGPALKNLALLNRVKEPRVSLTLAPSDHYLREWGLTLPPAEGPVLPIVIGCVTYETVFKDGLHQTLFAFSLTKSEGNKFERLIKAKESLPAQQIMTSPMPSGYSD